MAGIGSGIERFMLESILARLSGRDAKNGLCRRISWTDIVSRMACTSTCTFPPAKTVVIIGTNFSDNRRIR